MIVKCAVCGKEDEEENMEARVKCIRNPPPPKFFCKVCECGRPRVARTIEEQNKINRSTQRNTSIAENHLKDAWTLTLEVFHGRLCDLEEQDKVK